MKLVIESERLFLRPWRLDDAEALFKYASDGRVSELALWPRHTSVEMSREVIERFFIPNPECYAVVLKETDEAVGKGVLDGGHETFNYCHHTGFIYAGGLGYFVSDFCFCHCINA